MLVNVIQITVRKRIAVKNKVNEIISSQMKEPLGLKIIMFFFFIGIIVNIIEAILRPIEIGNSKMLGRVWLMSWTILYGISFYGLFKKMYWTSMLLVSSYFLSIITAITMMKWPISLTLIILSSIIYIPAIYYSVKFKREKREKN